MDMPLCIFCDHEVHGKICSSIEGKINGVDRECTCVMTAAQNKDKLDKIKKRDL